MSEFDYVNARLHSRKARLLPGTWFEQATGCRSVERLMNLLLQTGYRTFLQSALLRARGLDAIHEAVRESVGQEVRCIRGWFEPAGRPAHLASVALREFDRHNLKTILRGVANHVPAGEILPQTLPGGDLGPDEISQLAAASDLAAVIDLVVTWRLDWARPLLEARARPGNPPADLDDLETALERWHVATGLEAARTSGRAGAALVEALLRQADITNLLTALRARDEVEWRAHAIGPGRLGWDLFGPIVGGGLAAAVGSLAGTYLGNALRQVTAEAGLSAPLSRVERTLARTDLAASAGALMSDPLGIGVLLGYLALRRNEATNLRLLAMGLAFGDSAQEIRAEMIGGGA
ncbi:MAG TPA: V-type ATPase subunit [Alphaproteobacteria bacterium]